MKLSTASTFDESKYETIGIVESAVTHSVSSLRRFWTDLMGTFGGKNEALNRKIMDARDEALDELKHKASKMGADMVIGVSLTTDVIVSNTGGEFISFAGLGTALKRKDVSGGRRKTYRKKTEK